MIPVLLFSLCFFGFGDCGESQYHQELDELILEIQIEPFELTMNDYVGNGCLETKYENPLGYGKVIASQSWYDGIYRHYLNGTELTEVYCSHDVWEVFEDGYDYDIDYDYGKTCYDGEWLRFEPNDNCKPRLSERIVNQNSTPLQDKESRE